MTTHTRATMLAFTIAAVLFGSGCDRGAPAPAESGRPGTATTTVDSGAADDAAAVGDITTENARDELERLRRELDDEEG